MIGFLRGRVLDKKPPMLLLDVGGVGYELEAPMTAFYELPDGDAQVALFVHCVVRDDAHLLFGFTERTQRELFRVLLRVSGVGPRVALAILSTLRNDEFAGCIHRGDVGALTRVPGIGAKTAEQIIFQLRDRMADFAVDSTHPPAADAPEHDAAAALLALGYNAAAINRALRAVRSDANGREELIKSALQYLSAPAGKA